MAGPIFRQTTTGSAWTKRYLRPVRTRRAERYKTGTGKGDVNALQNLVERFGHVRSVGRREEGQTLVEYALILVLIAVVVVAVVATLGGTLQSIFSNVASSI